MQLPCNIYLFSMYPPLLHYNCEMSVFVPCAYYQVGCKVVIVFFQYCIMASFFWLLVEGLYLHALLAVSFFSERKYFWAYILIGWGENPKVTCLYLICCPGVRPQWRWTTACDPCRWDTIIMLVYTYVCVCFYYVPRWSDNFHHSLEHH